MSKFFPDSARDDHALTHVERRLRGADSSKWKRQLGYADGPCGFRFRHGDLTASHHWCSDFGTNDVLMVGRCCHEAFPDVLRLGQASLLRATGAHPGPVSDSLRDIEAAAERAADMASSGRQNLPWTKRL